MGDFAGGLLKYLRAHPLPRLTIAGGFAKMSKLAAGHLDLHSGRSQVDAAWLAQELAGRGAGAETVARAAKANSALEVLQLAAAAGIDIGGAVAARARATAMTALAGAAVAVETLVFDREGQLVGRSGP